MGVTDPQRNHNNFSQGGVCRPACWQPPCECPCALHQPPWLRSPPPLYGWFKITLQSTRREELYALWVGVGCAVHCGLVCCCGGEALHTLWVGVCCGGEELHALWVAVPVAETNFMHCGLVFAVAEKNDTCPHYLHLALR